MAFSKPPGIAATIDDVAEALAPFERSPRGPDYAAYLLWVAEEYVLGRATLDDFHRRYHSAQRASQATTVVPVVDGIPWGLVAYGDPVILIDHLAVTLTLTTLQEAFDYSIQYGRRPYDLILARAGLPSTELLLRLVEELSREEYETDVTLRDIYTALYGTIWGPAALDRHDDRLYGALYYVARGDEYASIDAAVARVLDVLDVNEPNTDADSVARELALSFDVDRYALEAVLEDQKE